MNSGPSALLINPPIFDFALFDLFLKPWGLLRTGRWLEEGGYNVGIIDCLCVSDEISGRVLRAPRRRKNGTGKFYRQTAALPSGVRNPGRPYFRYGIVTESIEHRLRQCSPDLILVSTGMTYWYPGVKEVIDLCRKIHPKVPLIAGGIYASLMPEHCKGVCGADSAAEGPALPQLAAFLEKSGLPLPVQKNMPADPLFFPEVWNGAGILRLNEGCPNRCDYCASFRLCPRFRQGTAEQLYSDYRYYYDRGIRNFAFYDDALLVGKEKGLYPFLERVAIKGDRPAFYLPNAVHAKFLDKKCAGLMYRAGFREIRIGFESDEQDFHVRHGSAKVNADFFRRAVENLTSAGFSGRQIIAYTLAGLPGQQAEEAEQAVRFVCDLGVRVSVSEYSPVPGSVLWEKALALSPYDIAGEPVYQSNNYFSCEWDKFSREDMKRIRDQAFKSNKGLLADS